MNPLKPLSTSPSSDQRARRQIAQLEQCFEQVVTAVESGRPLDVRLSEIFAGKRELGSRDRRLMKETIYAYFRWKGWIDRLELPTPAKLAVAGHLAFLEPPPALQMLASDHFLTLPPVDSSLVPAVRDWMASIADPLLSVSDLVPPWVLGSLADAVKDNLPEAWQIRPPVWIRSLEGRQDLVRSAFESEGYTVSGAAGVPLAFEIDRAFPEKKLFKQSNHGFYIQDLASQVTVEVCIRLGADRWWDACAGSGGKAFALADAANTQVFASDSRTKITRILQQRKAALGLNVQVGVLDATKELPRQGLFQGVLVDAPCTGLGTWSRNPDHRWRSTESDIRTHRQEQINLLHHVAQAVEPGGFLVYSVCTLTSSETENVVQEFLNRHSDFQPWQVTHPLHEMIQASQLWIHPSDGPCNGMFIAIFQKRP